MDSAELFVNLQFEITPFPAIMEIAPPYSFAELLSNVLPLIVISPPPPIAPPYELVLELLPLLFGIDHCRLQ